MTPTPISPAIIGLNELILLYGIPKVGKTHTALTAPPPIYFLSVGQANEAKTFYSKAFQAKYASQLKPADLLIDVGRSSQECKDLAEKAIEECLSGKGAFFNSIVIDNATPLIDMQIDVALEITHGMKSEGGGDTSKTAKTKLEDYGATILQKGDWGIAKSMMQRFISELMTVEKHIVFIAHEYETYTPGPQQTQVLNSVSPSFIGKDRTNIANKFDNVWRMSREAQGVYCARTEAGQHPNKYAIMAGSRIQGVIPKDWQDPNISDAIAKFRKHAEEVGKK